MQRSFAEYDGFRKQRKVTRRETFLAEMDRVVPWQRLEALIEPHYPSGGTGRKPYALNTMLRIHFLQHWYGYSDPGMKAHIGVDTAHGLVHTVIVTTGKVSDDSMAEDLLPGDEATAHGDRGYADKTRDPDRPRSDEEIGPRWFVPFKRKQGCDTTPEQKRLNRLLAALRSAVEHPFRVLKRQFGYTQVRYRGLFKNEQHVFSQFALVNLYLARHAIAAGG